MRSRSSYSITNVAAGLAACHRQKMTHPVFLLDFLKIWQQTYNQNWSNKLRGKNCNMYNLFPKQFEELSLIWVKNKSELQSPERSNLFSIRLNSVYLTPVLAFWFPPWFVNYIAINLYSNNKDVFNLISSFQLGSFRNMN